MAWCVWPRVGRDLSHISSLGDIFSSVFFCGFETSCVFYVGSAGSMDRGSDDLTLEKEKIFGMTCFTILLGFVFALCSGWFAGTHCSVINFRALTPHAVGCWLSSCDSCSPLIVCYSSLRLSSCSGISRSLLLFDTTVI